MHTISESLFNETKYGSIGGFSPFQSAITTFINWYICESKYENKTMTLKNYVAEIVGLFTQASIY